MIYSDILNYILDNGVVSHTDIMYRCNTNSKLIVKYIHYLFYSQLIRKQSVKTMRVNIKNNEYVGVTITRDNIKYLIKREMI